MSLLAQRVALGSLPTRMVLWPHTTFLMRRRSPSCLGTSIGFRLLSFLALVPPPGLPSRVPPSAKPSLSKVYFLDDSNLAATNTLNQGTGGVSTFALKLARASGLKVILTSSSDEKLEQIKKQFGKPEIQTINYKTHPQWQKEVLRLTNGIGVDLVVENGGSSSLVRSMECTRRGGIVSQVGYLGGSKPEYLREFISTIIDRRLNVRGINAGSKDDQDELMAAISATQMTFEDILDSIWAFDKADEAIEYVWQGKQVGKVVVKLND
jgi:NADPH:quinone reductase-like Zn-dependent oxidoreductase